MNDERPRDSRRRFLLSLLALGGAVALGGSSALWRARNRALAGRLRQLLGDLEAARTLGRRYLAKGAAETDEDAIVAGLVADLGSSVRLADSRDLALRVDDCVRSDYAAGRVRQIDGWILSRTELRLCSLAALGAPGGDASDRPRRPGPGRARASGPLRSSAVH